MDFNPKHRPSAMSPTKVGSASKSPKSPAKIERMNKMNLAAQDAKNTVAEHARKAEE